MLFAITLMLFHQLSVVPAANKQLQRTVIPNRWRAARRVIELCARGALDSAARGR
jgi:hypothetical protein